MQANPCRCVEREAGAAPPPASLLPPCLLQKEKPPDNSRYLPAYEGANATCFSLIARFHEKDVRIMFSSLHQAAEAAEAAAVRAAVTR